MSQRTNFDGILDLLIANFLLSSTHDFDHCKSYLERNKTKLILTQFVNFTLATPRLEHTPNDGYYPGCEEDDLSMRGRDANMVCSIERIALLLTEPHTVLYVKSWHYAWREMSKSTSRLGARG